ncbi:class I SAM-dependent methyltransferase [Elioraea rosea]|uniref:class I SAM-dependent methyltransferase n=1 Tax=Elioraea rosea TaxID=2492390 RepID=UPI00118673B0|nr:class I SAM-dependent methyltransferase [Elioraea rosea]
MSGWSGGYVSDIDYLPGYFIFQSPPHLTLALTIAGFEAVLPEDFAYCELGCGLGLTAGVIAAANPKARIVAVDFLPGQIATARALAAEAGLSNIDYLEADFADLADDPPPGLPMFDVVSLHGVWSWVSDATRAAIIRFLARRVKPGGIVHVGYSAMPAWTPIMGLRRFLADHAAALPGRSDHRILSAMEAASKLRAAGARHLARSPWIERILDREKQPMPAAYLAHEYLNENWRPMFAAEVAEAFAPAKLAYAASATLTENYPELCFSEEQRALIDAQPTEAARETARDLCFDRGFRHDLFLRGRRHISDHVRSRRLAAMTLALVKPPGDVTYEVEVPGGKAEMAAATYKPIFAALAERPRTVAELQRTGAAAGGAAVSSVELVGMLVGSHQALPVANPAAPASEQARRHAAAITRAWGFPGRGLQFAIPSPRLGAGIPAYQVEMQVFGALVSGCAPETAMVSDWIAGELSARGEAVLVEGVPAPPDQARETIMGVVAEVLDKRLPLWRSLAAL